MILTRSEEFAEAAVLESFRRSLAMGFPVPRKQMHRSIYEITAQRPDTVFFFTGEQFEKDLRRLKSRIHTLSPGADLFANLAYAALR
jgi:hypothetical protein